MSDISSVAQQLGVNLSPAQLDLLQRYLALVQKWNKVYNLTALRDPADMLTHHLFDSLSVVAPLQRQLQALGLQGGARLLDVGSGAGLPGVVLGAFTILQIPERAATLALGWLTLGLGVYSVFKPRLGMDHAPRHQRGPGLWLGMAGLFGVGVLNGSITSGTALFLTLWLIRWFGLDYTRAVAYTLILCGLVWNGTGALVLGTIGTVAWSWIPARLVGSVVGGYLGSHFAIMKGNLWIKRAFETVTILIGLKLILG